MENGLAKRLLGIITLWVLAGCTTPANRKTQKVESKTQEEVTNPPTEKTLRGYASWYGKELHGKPTASGEIFDMYKMTAAHRDFPMGSLVLVKNLENGKRVLVTINDRGPYVEGRIVDVSYAAAKELGFVEKGVALVEIELVQEGQDNFAMKALPPASKVEKYSAEKTEEEFFNEEDFYDEAEVIQKPSSKNSRFVFVDGARPKGYTIQIGAFKTRANAERHRAEMKARFQKPCFLAHKDNWYLVFIGDFKDSKKAREYLQKLRQEGVDVMYRGKVS